MKPLTDNQQALLRLIHDAGPGVSRRLINECLAGDDGIYAWDGWRWGMEGLIVHGFIARDPFGHFTVTVAGKKELRP
mgnify:FL=1